MGRVFFSNNIRKPEFYMLIVFYRIILDYLYENVISILFGYYNYTNERTTEYFSISWVLLFLFSFFVLKFYLNEKNLLSYEIAYVLFLISFVPFTTIVSYGNVNISYVLGNTIYWFLLIIYIYLFSLCSGNNYRLVTNYYFNRQFLIKLVSIVSFFVVIYISGRYTGLRINFRLSNVYALRAEASTYKLPSILVYVYSWSRMLNAILIAYYFRRRDWIWAVCGIVVQLLSFGIDGSKTTILLVVAVVIISFLPKFSVKDLNKWFLRAFVVLSILCCLSFGICHNIIPTSLFARRVLIEPVKIGSYYWDFFTSNSPDYFRQSFLRHFGFTSPYETISSMIGNLYFTTSTNANNGLIADAVANFGCAGIVIMPLLLASVLRIIDCHTINIEDRLCIIVAIYSATVLTNSFLFTVLMTHGMLISIVVLGWMQKRKEIIDVL